MFSHTLRSMSVNELLAYGHTELYANINVILDSIGDHDLAMR